MIGYMAFVKKEFMENTRNYRLFLLLTLFVIFGIMSPLAAKFTPELIATFLPSMSELPIPVALDSWAQFYKNISSLGFSLMIILFSNMLSSEYDKGTLIIMLTKGLTRPKVIAAKFTVAVAMMSICYWLSFAITYGYTLYIWPDTMLPNILFAAFALWLMGILYLCILMLGCVAFRQAFTAIMLLLVVTIAISLSGIPAQISAYSPAVLSAKNLDLLSGTAQISDFVIPIFIASIIAIGCLGLAISIFNKKQL